MDGLMVGVSCCLAWWSFAGFTRSDTRRHDQMTSSVSDVPETTGSRSFKVTVTNNRLETDSDRDGSAKTKMERRPAATTTTTTTTTVQSRGDRGTMPENAGSRVVIRHVTVMTSESLSARRRSDDVTTTTTKIERRQLRQQLSAATTTTTTTTTAKMERGQRTFDDVTETAGESIALRLDVDEHHHIPSPVPPFGSAATATKLKDNGEETHRSSPLATDEEISPNGTVATSQENDDAGLLKLDLKKSIAAGERIEKDKETLAHTDEEILPHGTVATRQDNEKTDRLRLDVDEEDVSRFTSTALRSSVLDVDLLNSRSGTRQRTTTDDSSWLLALSPNEGR